MEKLSLEATPPTEVLALAASDGAWRFALRVLSAMRRARAQVNEVCLTAAAAAFEAGKEYLTRLPTSPHLFFLFLFFLPGGGGRDGEVRL